MKINRNEGIIIAKMERNRKEQQCMRDMKQSNV